MPHEKMLPRPNAGLGSTAFGSSGRFIEQPGNTSAMKRPSVIKVEDVASFTPTGAEGKYESRMLVDAESVGSCNLVVNHFTLKPGQKTYLGHHPAPFEEVYYILRGRGVLTLGNVKKRKYEVVPDTIAYIAAMEDHQIENVGSEDLEMLTMMPFQPTPGVNSLYDERKKVWGTSFRLIAQRSHPTQVDKRSSGRGKGNTESRLSTPKP